MIIREYGDPAARVMLVQPVGQHELPLIDDVAGHYAQRIALTPLLKDDPVGVDLLAEMAG